MIMKEGRREKIERDQKEQQTKAFSSNIPFISRPGIQISIA
jgi:hypothetical protein